MSAQFRKPCCHRQVDLRLEVVKLHLHPPESRPNVPCDLLAKVADADCAACQYPNERCHEQDHLHHPLWCRASSASMRYATGCWQVSICHVAPCQVACSQQPTCHGDG